MNFRRVLLASLLLCASVPSLAGVTPAQIRDQVVSSLSVSGTIEVDPQGRVHAYAIKEAAAYDQAVRDMLDRNITRWTFKPVLVDGAPRQARFDMYLRLQAKPLDEKRYEVAISSAAFGSSEAAAPHTEVSSRRMRGPQYPLDEMRRGIGGTVVLVVRIGRDGTVADAFVEQTNLKAVGDASAMQRWRAEFEKAALVAARRWTFDPPTVGALAAEPHWDARVPVAYIPFGAKVHAPVGEWESYVPGPRHRAPWAKPALADNGVDALPGGRLFPMEQPLHLLTSLNPG
jgi:hypothetical protein